MQKANNSRHGNLRASSIRRKTPEHEARRLHPAPQHDLMKRIYIAGPYTKGDVAVNVKRAMEAGLLIARAGHAPFIPHLYHFAHMLDPQPYETWTEIDLAWLDACHYFFRLPGDSAGAEIEEIRAAYLGLPIFYDIYKLLDALK